MPSYKSRISQKHDTETNWNKATNFVPLAGEIIVYDADTENGARIKIGDGTTQVKSLKIVAGEKSGKQTSDGGFQGGEGASAQAGGAVGNKASAQGGGAIGYDASAGQGGAIGSGAIADAGGAIGMIANAGNGGAVGNNAQATTGGAVGQSSKATTGGGVGQGAQAVDGFAGGYLAHATASGAVQLGTGTNNNANTLQFRTYQICDANGNIPAERLGNSPVTSVNNKTGVVSLTASDVGAAALSATQDWTAEQRFNAGFSALNNNFRFGDTTNIGMELGRQDGTAGTPYIDFHTDGKSSTDYNSRILASGNQLQITASGGMSLNGQRVMTDIIEDISFNLNTEYFSSVMDGSNRRTNMFKLFGTDMVFVIVSLLTVKEIGKASVFMLNQFESRYAGYRVQTGIVCRSSHEPVGRIRINGGGTAIWLDTFDNINIATNSTLEATFLYRCTY